MSAAPQLRFRGSAMGIALALSLGAHLPLLLLWNDADPAPPVMAGGRVHLQLNAPPETVTAETVSPQSGPPQPVPHDATRQQASHTPAKPLRPKESSDATAPTEPVTPATVPVASQIAPPPVAPAAEPTSVAFTREMQDVAHTATSPAPASVTAQPPGPATSPAQGPLPAPTNSEPQLAAQTAQPAPAPSPAVHQQLQQALNRALLDHFSYPLKARRRHWEGEVVLRVTILHNGLIGAARIDKSSGHQLLDQAALESLRQVPSLSGFTLQKDIDLLLPVIYRLRG